MPQVDCRVPVQSPLCKKTHFPFQQGPADNAAPTPSIRAGGQHTDPFHQSSAALSPASFHPHPANSLTSSITKKGRALALRSLPRALTIVGCYFSRDFFRPKALSTALLNPAPSRSQFAHTDHVRKPTLRYRHSVKKRQS